MSANPMLAQYQKQQEENMRREMDKINQEKIAIQRDLERMQEQALTSQVMQPSGHSDAHLETVKQMAA